MTVVCFCGAPANLESNAKIYGREYGNGKAWICSRWPQCDGSVGTDPQGKPLGTMANWETKKLRFKVHDLIDPIWQNSGLEGKAKRGKRGAVYGWMRDIMQLDHPYHTANLTADECRRAIELIAKFPYEEHRKRIHAERGEERLPA